MNPAAIESDINLPRTASHEAAHAAAALLLGWNAGPVWIRSGEGSCSSERPTGRPERLLDEQAAIILICGQRAVGWQAWPGDHDDRRAVAEIMGKYCSDPYSYPRMLAGLEGKADALIASEQFAILHRDLVSALLAERYLTEQQVREVQVWGFERAVVDWEEERRQLNLRITRAAPAVPVEASRAEAITYVYDRRRLVRKTPRRRLSRDECYALLERVVVGKGLHEIAAHLKNRRLP